MLRNIIHLYRNTRIRIRPLGSHPWQEFCATLQDDPYAPLAEVQDYSSLYEAMQVEMEQGLDPVSPTTPATPSMQTEATPLKPVPSDTASPRPSEKPTDQSHKSTVAYDTAACPLPSEKPASQSQGSTDLHDTALPTSQERPSPSIPASQPSPSSLSKEATQEPASDLTRTNAIKRLNRMTKQRVDGSYGVPKELVERFQNPDTKESVITEFLECGGLKEWVFTVKLSDTYR